MLISVLVLYSWQRRGHDRGALEFVRQEAAALGRPLLCCGVDFVAGDARRRDPVDCVQSLVSVTYQTPPTIKVSEGLLLEGC